jgi:hypothetical protein
MVWSLTVSNALKFNPSSQRIDYEPANSRREQCEPDSIREKPWCQEQRTRKQDHRPMCKRLCGISQLLHRASKAVQYGHTLASDKKGAEDRCGHNDQKRPTQTNKPPNLNKESDLDQRDDQKKQKQSHVIPFAAVRPVDLQDAAPYICALIR